MSTTTIIRTFFRKYPLIAVLLLTVATSVRAQDERRFTLNAGAGFSPLVGQLSDRLDNGWHVTVGGGYRFTRHFETNLQFTYNGCSPGKDATAAASYGNCCLAFSTPLSVRTS